MGRGAPCYLVITPTQAFMSRDSPLNESLCELVQRARYTHYGYTHYGYTYYGYPYHGYTYHGYTYHCYTYHGCTYFTLAVTSCDLPRARQLLYLLWLLLWLLYLLGTHSRGARQSRCGDAAARGDVGV